MFTRLRDPAAKLLLHALEPVRVGRGGVNPLTHEDSNCSSIQWSNAAKDFDSATTTSMSTLRGAEPVEKSCVMAVASSAFR